MDVIKVGEGEETAGLSGEAPNLSQATSLELSLMRVRLRASRRAAWLAHLFKNPPPDAFASFDAAVQASLDDRDTPEAEAAWLDSAEQVRPLNERLRDVEQALEGEAGAGLQRLAEMFCLSEPEVDLLQTCLAIEMDPTLAVAFGYLQHHPHRSYATEALAARLFGYGRRSLWSPGLPLAGWGLITASEAAAGDLPPLAVDPVVVAWLHGDLRVDAALIGLVGVVEPQSQLESWPVDDAVRLIQRGLDRESAVRLVIAGPPSSGRRTFAAAIAARFGIQTLGVDIGQIADDNWPDLFMRAQRLAVLGRTALVWHGGGLHREVAERNRTGACTVCRL